MTVSDEEQSESESAVAACGPPRPDRRLGFRKFGNAVEYRTGRGLAFGTGFLQVRRLTGRGWGKRTRRSAGGRTPAQFFSRTRSRRRSIGDDGRNRNYSALCARACAGIEFVPMPRRQSRVFGGWTRQNVCVRCLPYYHVTCSQDAAATF